MGGDRRPFSILRRYAKPQTRTAVIAQEVCELCSEPMPFEHRHLLEMATRQTTCVCRACTILFDAAGASSGKYRLIPDRYLFLADFRITETQWQGLHIPVGLAFCFYSAAAQRMVAFYPGPMGATESLLDLQTWEELQERHTVLATLQHDVEALLLRRASGVEEYFVVPLDQCYRLVGLMRLHWRGLSGGQEVRKAVSGFFETLRQQARTVRPEDVGPAPRQSAP